MRINLALASLASVAAAVQWCGDTEVSTDRYGDLVQSEGSPFQASAPSSPRTFDELLQLQAKLPKEETTTTEEFSFQTTTTTFTAEALGAAGGGELISFSLKTGSEEQLLREGEVLGMEGWKNEEYCR